MALLCLGGIVLGLGYSFIKPTYSKKSYSGIVYTVKENYFLFNSGGERLYVYSKGHSYDLGDYLTISGKKEELDFTVLESGFDFKSYLNKKGVFNSLNPKHIEVKWHNFIRINESREKALSHFNDEERSVVGAILFSDGGESATSESLTNLHLARFLSASGLYISLFALGLNYLLKLFLKDKHAEIITISLLAIYLVFTIPKFSVFRVVFLLLLKWINKHQLKKKFTYLEVVSFGGLICLLFDHFLALQDSFILGFAIPIISYLIRHIYPSEKIKSYLWRSFTIYLFFLPFEIIYYHKVVVLSFPLQIISTPLFLLIGIVSLLCFFRIPMYVVDKGLVFLLKGYTGIIKPLSFGLLMPEFNIGLLIVYYAIYVIYLYYLTIGVRPIQRWLSIGMVAITSLYAIPIENRLTSEVSFVNVGQGDCTLIRHHQKTILIDTGGLTYNDIANGTLIPYLRKKRIYKIDAVFITHYDYDHYGALENLQKEYKVTNVYDYYSSFPINVNGLTFNNYNIYGTTSNEENDRSLVLSFNILNKDFLIMGDAPSWIENKIMDDYERIPCDILKLGHHGSDTSSSDKFIQYTSPKIAIVSCGKNNKFGHPSKSVVNTLNKYHIPIRRTDLEGTITYKQFD
ncbi:MAG: MBL fold metallo-hydrolase [Bacilli bacterium]|nr:MBL fold metallo-hydrolase [Bacilli bacterium]